jgi:hypothetical protein
MDPSVKNLRDWVALLFSLFCVLDIAAVQYGMSLARTAPLHPEPLAGAIIAMIQGPRGAWYHVYVTQGQMTLLRTLLGGAALSLLATLGLIVGHGMRVARSGRKF